MHSRQQKKIIRVVGIVTIAVVLFGMMAPFLSTAIR